MLEQFQQLVLTAREVFGDTRLWPVVQAALFTVFAALCLHLDDRLLPAWAKRGVAAGGAILRRLGAWTYHEFRAMLTPPPAPVPRWARRLSAAGDVFAGSWFALFSFGWFIVYTAVALDPRPSAASLGRRCLALGFASVLLVVTRVFANSARYGLRRWRD